MGRIVCIREVQKTLAQSAKLLIENKIQEFGVGFEFRVLYDRIETPGGGSPRGYEATSTSSD